MDDQEINQFMRTYGGGGKPIGAEHENFGIGAKVTLLPWNREGIVVISYKDGLASMIRLKHDPVSNAFIWTAENEFGGDEQVIVVSPDEFGIAEWGITNSWGDLEAGAILGRQADAARARHDRSFWLGTTLSKTRSSAIPIGPRSARRTSPARYLNTRIWQVPEEMTITRRRSGVPGQEQLAAHRARADRPTRQVGHRSSPDQGRIPLHPSRRRRGCRFLRDGTAAALRDRPQREGALVPSSSRWSPQSLRAARRDGRRSLRQRAVRHLDRAMAFPPVRHSLEGSPARPRT